MRAPLVQHSQPPACHTAGGSDTVKDESPSHFECEMSTTEWGLPSSHAHDEHGRLVRRARTMDKTVQYRSASASAAGRVGWRAYVAQARHSCGPPPARAAPAALARLAVVADARLGPSRSGRVWQHFGKCSRERSARRSPSMSWLDLRG